MEYSTVPNFNMAMLFLMQLNQRREDCAKAAISGDYITWYRTLQEIWRSVKAKIEQLEEKRARDNTETLKIEEQLTAIKEKLTKIYGNALTLNEAHRKQYVSTSYTTLDTELDKLYSDIMELLWRYDFVFPKKESYTLEDELEADLTGD